MHDFQNGGFDVIRKTRFPQKFNFFQKWSKIYMDALSDCMLLKFSKKSRMATNVPTGVHTHIVLFSHWLKIQDGRHGAILICVREFVATPPDLQVVDTLGFHHKVQFSLRSLPF